MWVRLLFPISAFISICVLYHILLLFLFGISKASAGLFSKWHSIISYCKNAVIFFWRNQVRFIERILCIPF